MFLEEGADGGPNASVALMGGEPLLNRRRLATISRTFSRTASNTFGPVVIEQTFSTSVMVTASFRIGLNRVCRRICLFLCRRGRRSPRTFCFPNPLDPFVRASASAELGASYSFNALGSVSASTAANSNIELFRGPKVRTVTTRARARDQRQIPHPCHVRPSRPRCADPRASRSDPDRLGAQHRPVHRAERDRNWRDQPLHGSEREHQDCREL